MKRIHRGRQKIEIKKMTDQNNLHVTFSKRRFGVFKKASELCILCGVDVAVIVFSPGKKVYSFGHKSVDSVIQHFVNGVAPTTLGPTDLIRSYRENTIRDLNAELMQVLEQLDMETKRAQELSKMRKANQAQCWWQNPVSEMNKEQLGQLKLALEELQKNVTKQSQTILFQNLNNVPQSYGPGQVMLPTAGINDSDIFCLSNADANGNVFDFDPNVVPPPPPPAAMPPSYNFEFGSNGFY